VTSIGCPLPDGRRHQPGQIARVFNTTSGIVETDAVDRRNAE
jgi:hypothetical protein